MQRQADLYIISVHVILTQETQIIQNNIISLAIQMSCYNKTLTIKPQTQVLVCCFVLHQTFSVISKLTKIGQRLGVITRYFKCTCLNNESQTFSQSFNNVQNIIQQSTFSEVDIIQLKYTIEGVSKIPVPQEQAYFPRGTGILLTPSMVYFNCFIIPIQTINLKEPQTGNSPLLLSIATVNWFRNQLIYQPVNSCCISI